MLLHMRHFWIVAAAQKIGNTETIELRMALFNSAVLPDAEIRAKAMMENIIKGEIARGGEISEEVGGIARGFGSRN